ncbi:hypothetical protein ACOSQ2_022325 [Xanthoceras sorbifolium]
MWVILMNIGLCRSRRTRLYIFSEFVLWTLHISRDGVVMFLHTNSTLRGCSWMIFSRILGDSSHALTKRAHEDDRVAQSELRVLSRWKYWPRQAMQELPDKLLIRETSAARSPCEDGQPV